MKFSVIIPAYNEEKYIVKTLKAINNQTLSKEYYEIIVVDDESTDNTLNVAREYCDVLIRSKKCKTIAEVRNKGSIKARGEILVFIDADTIIPENFLEKLLNVKEKCGVPKYISFGKHKLTFLYNFNYFLIRYLPRFSITQGCCMFFNKSFFYKLKGFNINMKINEDSDLFRRIINLKESIGVVNLRVVTSDRRIKKNPKKYILNQIKIYIKFLLGLKQNDYILIR